VNDSHYHFLVGIDWATEQHKVCLLDSTGRKLEERTVLHSAEGVGEFLDWLMELCNGQPERAAIAIEVPRGPVVESALERGFPVFSINPKQLDRFRDRYFPSGCKDDGRDAFVAADSLRTDQHCFSQVCAEDPLILRLRELSRFDDELRLSLHRHCCQLREQLLRYFPQIFALTNSLDEPWIWALLEAVPTPAKAARLSAARVEKILRQYRISRVTSAQILAICKTPGFSLIPGAEQAASEHMLLLLPHLRLLHQQRKQLHKAIQELLDQIGQDQGDRCQHRDLEIILSLPGIGNLVAATMLAEASRALAQRDYHALRCYGGLAPVTRQSGKSKVVLMRRACNPRVRNAVYHWARVSVQHDPRSREHYHLFRKRGHSHARALRGVADRLLAMLCAMLKAQTLYDPTRRTSRSEEAA
jgi:transposase